MVNIYYTRLNQKLPDELFSSFLNELPTIFSDKILKYKRWEDAQASLYGKLLLKKGLKDFSNPELSLHNIQIDKNNKPFLSNSINFNISHSGNYIVCALSTDTQIGIDIEKILPINYADFDRVFIPREMEEIKNSQLPLEKFYEYWTKKESAIKADSRGLGIPLHEVVVQNEQVVIGQHTWYVKPLVIEQSYMCHLAIAKNELPISLTYIDFN